MTRENDSPAITLLSFFYPFFSMLAPVLFFHSLFRDFLLFPWIYPLVFIILIFGGVLFFNPFCRNNLFEFEDLGNAFTDRIIFALIILSLLAALLVTGFDPYRLYLALPLLAALIQTYLTVLFQSLRFHPVAGIVRLTYIHIGKSLVIIITLLLFKAAMIISLQIAELPRFATLPAAAGFTADIIMIIFLRKHLYQLEMEKEGFAEGEITRNGHGSTVLLMVPAFLLSLFFLRDRAWPGPEVLLRFYRWLLSFSMQREMGEVPLSIPDQADASPDGLEDLQALWEVRKIDFVLIRKIFDVLGYILLGFIALLIVYFIFYPLFAPLFFRKRQNLTFREYYRTLLRGFLRFLRTLKSLFKPFRQLKRKGTGRDGAPLDGLFSAIDQGETVSAAKKAEVRHLHKIYRKLRTRGRRRLGHQSLAIVPVEDFFSLLSSANSSWSDSCRILAPLFNKSFFSLDRLDRKEMKMVKVESDRLMKEL